MIASILYSTDKQQQTKAHEYSVFTKDNIVKITLDTSQQSLEPTLVTTSTIKNLQKERETNA